MTLATANLIRLQIAEMVANHRFTKINQIGDGTHTRAEIVAAPYLFAAQNYWVVKNSILGKERDAIHKTKISENAKREWSEFINFLHHVVSATYSSGLFHTPIYLLLSSHHLDHYTNLVAKTDEHREAVTLRQRGDCAPGHDGSEDFCDVALSSDNFINLLNSLPIAPSEDYWRPIYSVLRLSYPPFDPDRLTADLDIRDIKERFAAFEKNTDQIVSSKKHRTPTLKTKDDDGAIIPTIQRGKSTASFLRWTLLYVYTFLFVCFIWNGAGYLALAGLPIIWVLSLVITKKFEGS
jgi:hypothetical protein